MYETPQLKNILTKFFFHNPKYGSTFNFSILSASKAQAKQSKVAVIDGNWWSSQAKTRAAAIQPPPLVNCGLPPRM